MVTFIGFQAAQTPSKKDRPGGLHERMPKLLPTSEADKCNIPFNQGSKRGVEGGASRRCSFRRCRLQVASSCVETDISFNCTKSLPLCLHGRIVFRQASADGHEETHPSISSY